MLWLALVVGGGEGLAQTIAEAVAKYRWPLLKHPFEDFKYFFNAL